MGLVLVAVVSCSSWRVMYCLYIRLLQRPMIEKKEHRLRFYDHSYLGVLREESSVESRESKAECLPLGLKAKVESKICFNLISWSS
jgi:hypothetical protein